MYETTVKFIVKYYILIIQYVYSVGNTCKYDGILYVSHGPKLINSGLKENPELPAHIYDFAVAFMCVRLVNMIFQT